MKTNAKGNAVSSWRNTGARSVVVALALLALVAGCTQPASTPAPEPPPSPVPTAAPATPSGAPAPPSDAREMQVTSLLPERDGGWLLVLQVKGAEHYLPMGIGGAEGLAIASELEGVSPRRPMTHDLLKSVIDSLDGDIVYVMVTEMVASAIHSVIVIQQGERVVEIDARSSDAVALALRFRAPIFATHTVMDQAGVRPGDPEVLPL